MALSCVFEGTMGTSVNLITKS